MGKHVAKMISDVPDCLHPSEPGLAFDLFLKHPVTDVGADNLTMASIILHFRSLSRLALPPCVNLFHNTDLGRHLCSVVAGYTEAIDANGTNDLCQFIIDASTADTMKDVTRQNLRLDDSSLQADDTKLFKPATSGRWLGRLSTNELQACAVRMQALVSPAEIA